MNIAQLAQIVIGSIASIGVLIAGAGYGYGQFYKGKNAKTLDDFNLFNTQLDSLKKVCDEQAAQIKVLQEDIKGHTQEIGRLKGINEEKEKKIVELNAILQNRDPALNDFIKMSTESTKYFLDVVPKIITTIDTIKNSLIK